MHISSYIFYIDAVYTMNEKCSIAIHEFYTLKHDYDNAMNSKKQTIINDNNKYPNKLSKQQAIQNIKIPCIHCKRPVGSIFSTTNLTLKVICGASAATTAATTADTIQPCPLHIEIYKGRVSTLEEDFQIWLEDYLVDLRENILKTKLDVLFQYISEEQAVKQFQEYKEELETYQNGYNRDYQLYLDKTNNPQVNKDIETSIFKLADFKENIATQLDIYRKTKDKRTLKDIALTYMKNIVPLLHSIRDLKYNYIQMEYDSDDDTNHLITHRYTIRDLETNTNEEDEPKIIANKK